MEGGCQRQTGRNPHARFCQLTRWYPSESPMLHLVTTLPAVHVEKEARERRTSNADVLRRRRFARR